jgi:xanthine dehydrogenase YagS FAD-binding subunit
MLDELPLLSHVDAETVDEAVQWLARYGERAAPLAGGTDLLGLMKDGIGGPRMPMPEVLVNVKTIAELSRLDAGASGDLGIGAAVTLADLERDPLVTERYPALAQAAASVATSQIRSVGTVGGNLCQRPWCWYFRHPQFECFKRGGRQCFAIPGNNRTYFGVLGRGICVMAHPSDLAPALVALDARVTIAGPTGVREVDIERFFEGPRSVKETVLLPGEIVTRVDVPRPAPTTRTIFLKHRIRGSWDFALVSVAAAVTAGARGCADARIVLGGVAPYPFRAVAAEAELRGRRLGADMIDAATDAVLVAARPLSMNGYKLDVTRALLRRALTGLAG